MPTPEKLTDGQKRAKLKDTISGFEKSGRTAIHPSGDSGLEGRDLVQLLSLKNLSETSSLFQELLMEINNNEKLNIDELNLEGFISIDMPLGQMAPLVAESKKIKTLILSHNNLAWGGAEKQLINIFAQNKYISHLDISKTEIKGETVEEILKVNQSITHISFDRGTNFISDKQAEIIEKELASRQLKAQQKKSEEKFSDTPTKQEPSALTKPTKVVPLDKSLKSTHTI